MKSKETENMLWLVKHIHFFDFHTEMAQRFKVELQSWWANRRCDEHEAVALQKRFFDLCGANPVEAACGWYCYSPGEDTWDDGDKSRGVNEYAKNADISTRFFEGCFLKEEGLFVGMIPPEKRHISQKALLETYRAKTAETLGRAEASAMANIKVIRTDKCGKIYATYRNFTVFKALIHALLFVAAVWMIPVWIRIAVVVITGIINMAQGIGDLDGFLESLEQIPPFIGQDPVLVVATLICIPVVLLDIRQTIWEIYFGIYRWIARTKIDRAHQRTMKELQKAKSKVAPGKQILGTGAWKPAKQSVREKIGFQVPSWVRIGKNPRFSKKRSKTPFMDTFIIYPSEPLPGKGGRSRSFLGMLVRVAMLILLVLAIYWQRMG